MSVRRIGWIGLGLVVTCGFGCKESGDNGGGAGTGAPLAGSAAPVSGSGAAGTGMAGTGTAGTGTAGTGTAGTGTAGTGTAGTGTAGTGMAGTGTAGMDGAGMGGMGAAGMAGMDAAGMGGTGGGDPTQMCIDEAAAMGKTDACTTCGCQKCLDAIMNCQDEACMSVVDCGRENGCKGTDCFCGTADPIGCITGGANGPCQDVILAASGLDEGATALDVGRISIEGAAEYDPSNPVSRANKVSICTRGRDAADEIPGSIPAQTAQAGMCETECAPM